MNEFLDKQAIAELMQRWGFYRDQRMWDDLRSTFHPEGRIAVTWFSGKFSDFVDASIEMTKRRTGSKHWFGGSIIKLNGDRAVSETNAMIMGRSMIHGVEVDTVALARFYDLIERRDDVWRMLRREAIYEKDSVVPVIPGTSVPFDQEKLAAMPAPYRHLGYSLASQGFTVSRDLPTNGSASLERLYAEGTAWLAGGD